MYIENRAQKLVHFFNMFARASTKWECLTTKEQFDSMWSDVLDTITAELPSGSGFNNGTTFSDESKPDRLIFDTSFHHMNDVGYYDGWTEHRVIVTPAFEYGFHIKVTGRNRNDIKDHIAEVFGSILSSYWITELVDGKLAIRRAAVHYNFTLDSTDK